jgi:hypothetical protein
MTAEIISRLEVSFEREADWENALENIADALARIEKLESQVEDLRYSTGSRDYAGNEDY